MPTANTLLYCTEADVQALLSVDGEQLRLADTFSETSPSVTEEAYLTLQGINYATARINQFCLGRYDDSDLVTSWVVNDYCVTIAARWLCQRRGNPVPNSIKERYDEALAELKQIMVGALDINDIGLRKSPFPTWSNVVVRQEYNQRKVRVETQSSDTPPTDYPQAVDWSTAYYFEI